MYHSGASAVTNAPNSFVRTKLIDVFLFAKADIGKIAAKVPIVRINDIRPRTLLRQRMNGRFGEAAPQRRHDLDR
jgi:hypothetical protein